MGYIYKITNDFDSKFYIGKCQCSIEDRFKQHLRNAKKWSAGKNTYKSHLYEAMSLYGIEHFYVQEIEHCDNDILGNREKYWISKLNAQKIGYNITPGGSSIWEGMKHSAEAKEQISKTLKGQRKGIKFSEDHKKALSVAKKGKPSSWAGHHHSIETKEKLSDMKKGKASTRENFHHTPETRERLKASHTGKKQSEEVKIKKNAAIRNTLNAKSKEELSERTKKGWETRRLKLGKGI